MIIHMSQLSFGELHGYKKLPFIDGTNLYKNLPPIPYDFDTTGALIITKEKLLAIINAPEHELPRGSKEFIINYSTVWPENDSKIALRGSEYYKLTTQIDTHDKKISVSTLHKILTRIVSLIVELTVYINKKSQITDNQIIALLCLTDHAKGIILKLLDNEFNIARTKISPNYKQLLTLAQTICTNYYQLLTDRHVPSADQIKKEVEAIKPGLLNNQIEPKGRKRQFIDWIREMDNPLLILFQVNRICQAIKKGKPCDIVLTPFFGAAELGFALISRMEALTLPRLPFIVPIKFSGQLARLNLPQVDLFELNFDPYTQLKDKHIWILDDNILTGSTQIQLSSLIENKYKPASIHASVVQVSNGKISEDLEPKLKELLATRAVSPLFSPSAIPEEQINLYRFSRPLTSQLFHFK